MEIRFRQAERRDAQAIADIYERIHDREEAGPVTVGWVRGVYPTYDSAMESIKVGDMYVGEADGQIIAAARINQDQVQPMYSQVDWQHQASDEQVLVIHTLVVDPLSSRGGYGRSFVRFYEDMARSMGCTCLRMDTNELNVPARSLYASMGYSEAGIIPCEFNGIPGVGLVCLEKRL